MAISVIHTSSDIVFLGCPACSLWEKEVAHGGETEKEEEEEEEEEDKSETCLGVVSLPLHPTNKCHTELLQLFNKSPNEQSL